MPMMWRVIERALRDGELYEGEPFAFMRDDEGDPFVLCRQLVEVPPDATKATEVIGSLAEMPQ